jgi:hypothetical protein
VGKTGAGPVSRPLGQELTGLQSRYKQSKKKFPIFFYRKTRSELEQVAIIDKFSFVVQKHLFGELLDIPNKYKVDHTVGWMPIAKNWAPNRLCNSQNTISEYKIVERPTAHAQNER